jgi:hypothetical protein
MGAHVEMHRDVGKDARVCVPTNRNNTLISNWIIVRWGGGGGGGKTNKNKKLKIKNLINC